MPAVTFSGKDHLLKDCRLYVGGYNLSGDAMNFSSLDNAEEEVPLTGWSDSLEWYTISGRKTIGISGLQVFMNMSAGQAYAVLKDSPLQYLASVLFGGSGEPEIGDPAFLMPALQLADIASFDANRAILSIDQRFDAAKADAYAVNPLGYVLMDGVSQSATWNANGVNYGAAQVSPIVGSQAILFVLNASATTWTYKVQHSTDDSSYSDLLTFTANGSAITAERQSAATLVNQYVRFQGTKGAPAGSTQAICVFSRRQRL